MRGGRQIWPCRKAFHLGALDHRVVDDTVGKWFEVGFRSPEALAGNANDGWTDARGYVVMHLQTSSDLVNWSPGLVEDVTGSPTVLPDGSFEYWARAIRPVYYYSVLVDLTLTTARAEKEITGLRAVDATVPLPGYPYAMPTDAARLQTDLRAAGFSGATVTTATLADRVEIVNHLVSSARQLGVTLTAGNVESVRNTALSGNPVIALPNYPYAMPNQRAALQTDLRSAGMSGAVVRLFGDSWTINLPSRPAAGVNRNVWVEFTPGDPFPTWDMFGNSTGESAGTIETGTYSNVRSTADAPLEEGGRQFFRLAVDRGARYLP